MTFEGLSEPRTIPDMSPNLFDSLVRSLNKSEWEVLASSPKVIVTDVSTLAQVSNPLKTQNDRQTALGPPKEHTQLTLGTLVSSSTR